MVSSIKASTKPIVMLLKSGIEYRQVTDVIDWLVSPANMESDYKIEVQSGKSLRDKWDRIQAAMHRSKRRIALPDWPESDPEPATAIQGADQ